MKKSQCHHNMLKYVIFLFICLCPGVRADNEEVLVPVFIIFFIIVSCLLICRRIYQRSKPVGWILEANQVPSDQGYMSTETSYRTMGYPIGPHLPPHLPPAAPHLSPTAPPAVIMSIPEDLPPPYEAVIRQDLYSPVRTDPSHINTGSVK